MRSRLSRLILFVAAFLAATLVLAAPRQVPLSELFPSPAQTKSAVVINKVLERFHYKKVDIDSAFAQAVLDNYLEALDPSRSFFLARDVERFKGGAKRLDEGLRRGELDLAFDVFRVYRMRVDERVIYAESLLRGPFDFDRDETYTLDSPDAAWAKDSAELDEIWRRRVKNDFLTLRLADKTDEEIRERLSERYQGLVRRTHQFDGNDVFQTFMNAYTQTLEPHTSYMSPSTSENFDISMKLSLEGIGAVLRADNEYTVIQSTVPGGPARESGQVQTGDRIVGVAQGLEGPIEDVVGWRLQDVVDKIRGPKGSVVRLQLLPKSAATNGGVREVAIVRNEIKLEDQAAKAVVLDDLGNAPGIRIGVIEIPAFYRDFQAEGSGDRDFRSTTRDVRLLIDELVLKGVDGIVIDLRGNGGGSLAEATSLTGLFIDTGPVVQVKDAFGKIEVETDPEPGLAYRGPLAVLVDRDSASASEIFAGAIQDYGRGLVIGEPTFGKGTVQTLIDLNRYVPGEQNNLGRLRLTMAEFFRISGGSTQLRGVEPDIRFPTAELMAEHGERSLDNALPWTRIRPADYQKAGSVSVDLLALQSAERVSKDPGFTMLVERSKLMRDVEAQTQVSLQEKARRDEDKRRGSVFKEQQDAYLRARGIAPVDEDDEQVDEDLLDAQREAIARIQVEEAARILADAVLLDRTERPRAVMRD
ncbi:carboxy terminal-processing peptidase [Thiocapsa bogorovii]|uniref:carboxy terminal-processing peptidase n=1 Tax=Thiocapsa bogorovii TaxID=521689 RepID=UPI001E352FB2|nr:carboxy terminal-processing peptidase [Thiocapsa bogorovii]UHD18044.1 carboxy terminal-processing peptidase [Thiocapsa bogorovii]